MMNARSIAEAVLVAALAGCVGRPDVGNDGGSAGDGGSGIVLLAPLPGEPAPPNLAAVVVAFPGGAPPLDSITIEGVEPVARLAAPGDAVCGGAEEGSCVVLELAGPLTAGESYLVESPRGSVGFTTGGTWDTAPPAVQVTTAASDGCLVVTLSSSEPIWAAFAVEGTHVGAAAPAGVQELAHRWVMTGGSHQPVVTAVDLAGHELTIATPTIAAPRPPGWAVSEVLANPAGDEPAQEWVELVRIADDGASLAGLRISDGDGEDELPDVFVPAGGRALVVSASYDSSAPDDVAPAPETRMAYLEGPLGRAGLANAGEPVTLLDAEGITLSIMGAHDVSASSWNGRSLERRVVGGCAVAANAAANLDSRSTPGSVNSVEEAGP